MFVTSAQCFALQSYIAVSFGFVASCPADHCTHTRTHTRTVPNFFSVCYGGELLWLSMLHNTCVCTACRCVLFGAADPGPWFAVAHGNPCPQPVPRWSTAVSQGGGVLQKHRDI